MGWLDKLLFWRDEPPVEVPAVDGFTVDGCFTLPDEVSAPTPAAGPDCAPDQGAEPNE